MLKGSSCWELNLTPRSGLKKIEVSSENHCRVICLETDDCFFYSHDEDGCFIEQANTDMTNHTKKGHTLKEICKGW